MIKKEIAVSLVGMTTFKPKNPLMGMKLCKSLFCEQLPCIDGFEMNMISQASSLFGSVATLRVEGCLA